MDDGRVKTKTDPLCPRVIRRLSSMYVVESQPVGPMTPNGKFQSNFRGGIMIRQAWNFTSTRLLSRRDGVKDMSTVSEPRISFLLFLLKVMIDDRGLVGN